MQLFGAVSRLLSSPHFWRGGKHVRPTTNDTKDSTVENVHTSILAQPTRFRIGIELASRLPRDLREELLRQTFAGLAVRARFRRARTFLPRDAIRDEARHSRAARVIGA